MKKSLIVIITVLALVALVGCAPTNNLDSLESQVNIIVTSIDSINNDLSNSTETSISTMSLMPESNDYWNNIIDKYEWIEYSGHDSYIRNLYARMALPIKELVESVGTNSLLYTYNVDYRYINGEFYLSLPSIIRVVGVDDSEDYPIIYATCRYEFLKEGSLTEIGSYLDMYIMIGFKSSTQYEISMVAAFNGEAIEEYAYYNSETNDTLTIAIKDSMSSVNYNGRRITDLVTADRDSIAEILQTKLDSILQSNSMIESDNINGNRSQYESIVTLDFDVSLYNNITNHTSV